MRDLSKAFDGLTASGQSDGAVKLGDLVTLMKRARSHTYERKGEVEKMGRGKGRREGV